MAKTALTQLQDQIEAVRREAFAAGYAAAMQSIRDFVSNPAPGAEPAASRPGRRPGRRPRSAGAPQSAGAAKPAAPARSGRPAGKRQPRATARASARRPQRGTNARLVEEVLQSHAPRALHPAEIRRAVQHDKGVAMAFTSIRHALGQLEERRAAEQVGDSKTWRYRAGAASA